MFNHKSVQLFSMLLFCVSSSLAANREAHEVPPILMAEDVIDAKLLESDLYTIDKHVSTRGYTNTYRIKSKFGDFTAHGNAMLETRIHEINVINELDKIKKTEKFSEGLKEGAKTPFRFIKNLVTHPVDTVTGVPKGLWRYGTRIGEMATGDKSEYEDGIGKELILFSSQKRKLAYDLNVDVYSSNKILQEYLNSVSWASYSGSFAITAAMRPLGPVRFTKTASTMNALIRDNSPEDLRKINRNTLRELNVDDSIIKIFLDNIWISPRHETSITHSLQYLALNAGINDFIRLVSTSESEQDSFFFQNIIALIEHYSSNVVEDDISIHILHDFAVLKVRKHYVLPLLVDNGYWSEFGAQLINTLSNELRKTNEHDVQIVLWITGNVSERSKKELKAKNIILVERAYYTHGKKL